MIKNKIYIGDREREFILSERNRTGLSAESVSRNMGHAISWLAQIENGRVKTIKREDFIKLISILREEDDLKKVEAFIQASLIAISRNLPLPNSPEDEKVKMFIDNNDYTAAGLEESFQNWLLLINFFFKKVWDQYPYEKKELEDTLYNMLYNLQSNPSVALSVMGAPLNRLTNIGKDKQKEFIREYFSLIKKYGTDDDFDLFIINQMK